MYQSGKSDIPPDESPGLTKEILSLISIDRLAAVEAGIKNDAIPKI